MFENKIILSGIPQGYEALVLKRLMLSDKPILYILPNEKKLNFIQESLRIIAPDIPFLSFPAWETVPYDRTAPAPEVIGKRIDTLVQLIQKKDEKFILLTTASAVLQMVPPVSFFENAILDLSVGQNISFSNLKEYLIKNGYHHTNVVMDSGDFAVRGSIVDIFPAGFKNPVRMDFFDDEIETIKHFDPITQRTNKTVNQITLKPMSEFVLTQETIALFRSRYRDLFEKFSNDSFYEAVSEGHYIQGLEHFLPLFHQNLVPIFEYFSDANVILDFQTPDAFCSRIEQINEYYDARQQALTDGINFSSVYQPIPPNLFFLNQERLESLLIDKQVFHFSPFINPEAKDEGGRLGYDFVETRIQDKKDIFDVVADFLNSEKRKVILTASTEGSCQRLTGLFRERGLILSECDTFSEALKRSPSILKAPFERGFSTDKFIVVTETDILGERIIRPPKKRKNTDFLSDLTSLNINDLVVHQNHGIGKFIGLVPLKITGADHDCLCIEYDGGDKLFVPVENMDILSRYGNEGTVVLDRLGGTSFATRKNRVKKDLFKMAEQLMTIASARALNKTERILIPNGLYQEFCAHFSYTETEDQIRTIHEIENDLALGKPMDRLVCGDVGFGKTEVAMRAAFLSVMAGYQVAVVVPTTLLARQHMQNFIERFKHFPIRIAGLSRLVSYGDTQKIHEELKTGRLDIVVGTHTLLGKNIKFKNLGMVIIDEEQHFGVAHKERLKELKQGVHVLTLTATPIPRTLQLSLAGVRELSVIATPPVDRLAVKTFVTPFDTVIIKEALLREQFRGGQAFFVCPRISDMAEVSDILKKILPEARVVQAHGQMSATKLESIMTAFADKKYDILLATSIIESGLDMPSVNTMIVYRADMFGLAALYQLRGRVGRGKLRAYAYFTTPPHQKLSDMAQKRLTVMQGLDSLGAGFTLASHDLDIRGAGNLLGQEQSGHIREIGISLYQKMLAEAIGNLKRKDTQISQEDDDFSPQISIGLPVLIPATYISDLDVRMNLYHRLGDLKDLSDVESMRAELLDRFGAYPIEVENLLMTLELKIMAKKVNIERLEAGPKGANIAFRNNIFPNPAALVAYINTQMGTVRIRPDQKLIIMRSWATADDRLKGVRNLIKKFSELIK